MMKKFVALLFAAVLFCAVFVGCSGSSAGSGVENKTGLAEGTYEVTFKTDSTMFMVNEANKNKGILTVDKNGATVHVALRAKGIVEVFYGTAEDAKKSGAKTIKPTTEKVTYSDGYTEEVYAFDIPVSELDVEFNVAILGTKGSWYDHKVVVKNPQPVTK